MFLLPKNIYVIENHDEALTKWENWCVKSSTLIHFDAHMDFDNTINKKHINIGNFIGNAIIEGLFDKFVWVIPSPSYHSIAGYKFAVKCCKEYLMNIHYYRKILCGNLQIKEQVIFYLCSIENLAEIINSDLDITLDIDIDYFVNPYIWFDFSCLLPDSKWISLLDFYKKAKYMIENSKIITIAKSVIGGFTPLRYEYLAEALKNLIQNKGVLDEQYKILENGLGNNPNSDLSKSIMHKNTSLSTLAWSLEVNTTNINKEYYNLLLSKL